MVYCRYSEVGTAASKILNFILHAYFDYDDKQYGTEKGLIGFN